MRQVLNTNIPALQANNEFLRHPVVQTMNVIIGSLCWVGLTICCGAFFHRIWKANQSGKRW